MAFSSLCIEVRLLEHCFDPFSRMYSRKREIVFHYTEIISLNNNNIDNNDIDGCNKNEMKPDIHVLSPVNFLSC